MFKKVSQVSNGGSTTTHKLSILSRPITVLYLMEIKPIIFNWYILLHNDWSQVGFYLESILRSIPCIRKWLEVALFILRTIAGSSQQEVIMLENQRLCSNYPPFNIFESSSSDHLKTLPSTPNVEYGRYLFAFCGGASKLKTTSGLHPKVRFQHLSLENLSTPQVKSFSVNLQMNGQQDKVVTEIATDSESVPLKLTTEHMHFDDGGGLPPAQDLAYADDLFFFASRADSSQFPKVYVEHHQKDAFCLRFGLKLEWPINLKDEVDWLME